MTGAKECQKWTWKSEPRSFNENKRNEQQQQQQKNLTTMHNDEIVVYVKELTVFATFSSLNIYTRKSMNLNHKSNNVDIDTFIKTSEKQSHNL